nr:uncharacterized protein LOC112544737 [Pelodiscus sinensis]|eukprot:XP_025037247.1 uncharacterized protein LOC112544737 [Pelodiscus sinensis]
MLHTRTGRSLPWASAAPAPTSREWVICARLQNLPALRGRSLHTSSLRGSSAPSTSSPSSPASLYRAIGVLPFSRAHPAKLFAARSAQGATAVRSGRTRASPQGLRLAHAVSAPGNSSRSALRAARRARVALDTRIKGREDSVHTGKGRRPKCCHRAHVGQASSASRCRRFLATWLVPLWTDPARHRGQRFPDTGPQRGCQGVPGSRTVRAAPGSPSPQPGWADAVVCFRLPAEA